MNHDNAIMKSIREIDPTGKSVVYVPERDHDIREFDEKVGRKLFQKRKDEAA